MPNTEFRHACFNWRALSAGDHRNFDPGSHDLLDAISVVYVKDLGFATLRVIVQLTVGHDAVDVEHQQADGCKFFAARGV